MSSPDAVDIIAGSLQYDNAAEEDRDIDITLTCKRGDADLLAVRGIEVKRHKRPLTVEQVEQLCLKFKDIPGITERWIVSASGYTKGATNKAKAHGVQLLEFRDWDGKMPPPGNRSFAKDFQIIDLEYRWDPSPHLTLNPDESSPLGNAPIDLDAPVVDLAGTPLRDFHSVKAFTDCLVQKALDIYKDQDAESEPPVAIASKSVKVTINISNEVCIQLPNGLWRITRALVQGKISAFEIEKTLEFMALVNLSDGKPIVGCAIAEGRMGNLMAISLTEDTGTVSIVDISAGDRLLKKIKDMRL